MYRKSSSISSIMLTDYSGHTSRLTKHHSSPAPSRFNLETGTGSIWLYFNNHQQKEKSHVSCTNIQFKINLFYKWVSSQCHYKKDTENPYLFPSCWKCINCVYECMNYIISSKKEEKKMWNELSRSYPRISKGGSKTIPWE